MSQPPFATAADLPGLPAEDGQPVFREPWEAQVFAMAVRLSDAGHFTWEEWTCVLGTEIQKAGPGDPPGNYYLHWLRALEIMVDRHGLAGAEDLELRRRAWDRAARATPHGEPIVLGREQE